SVTVLRAFFVFTMDVIAPVRVIGSIRFYLVFNGISDKLVWIFWQRCQRVRHVLSVQSDAETYKKHSHCNAPQGIEVTHSVQKRVLILIRAEKAAASCILPFTKTAGDLVTESKKRQLCSRPFIDRPS